MCVSQRLVTKLLDTPLQKTIAERCGTDLLLLLLLLNPTKTAFTPISLTPPLTLDPCGQL